MLVYLDTSSLAHFDDALRKSPQEARAFQQAWNDLGSELAVSRHHLVEASQGAVPFNMERRLAAIRELGRVRLARFGCERVFECEIAWQLLATLSGQAPEYGRVRETVFPPATFDDVFRFAWTERENLERHTQLGRMIAERENANRGKLTERDARRRMKVFAKRLQQRELHIPTLVAERTKRVSPELRSAVEEQATRFLETLAETGNFDKASRKALFLDTFPAMSQPGVQDMAILVTHLTDMPWPGVNSWLQQLGYAPQAIASAVQRIDPYDMPGMSIFMAARRAWREATQVARPSQIVDHMHAAFAPHVDVLFADSETVSHIEAEVRDRPRLLRRFHECKLRRNASLERIADDLRAIGLQNRRGPASS